MSSPSCSSNDNSTPTFGYKERRREAHTQAEQKRRDAIKRGYEDLQQMVPTCQQQDSISSYKLSTATILQRSIDHIQSLIRSKSKNADEIKSLRKEVCALQIMKNDYEQMVKQHQQQVQMAAQHGQQTNQLSEQLKFQIFQAFCENLFISFDRYVSFRDFKDASSTATRWIEEHCNPQTLKQLCLTILQEFFPS